MEIYTIVSYRASYLGDVTPIVFCLLKLDNLSVLVACSSCMYTIVTLSRIVFAGPVQL